MLLERCSKAYSGYILLIKNFNLSKKSVYLVGGHDLNFITKSLMSPFNGPHSLMLRFAQRHRPKLLYKLSSAGLYTTERLTYSEGNPRINNTDTSVVVQQVPQSSPLAHIETT